MINRTEIVNTRSGKMKEVPERIFCPHCGSSAGDEDGFDIYPHEDGIVEDRQFFCPDCKNRFVKRTISTSEVQKTEVVK